MTPNNTGRGRGEQATERHGSKFGPRKTSKCALVGGSCFGNLNLKPFCGHHDAGTKVDTGPAESDPVCDRNIIVIRQETGPQGGSDFVHEPAFEGSWPISTQILLVSRNL
jgi:hypothetical protein